MTRPAASGSSTGDNVRTFAGTGPRLVVNGKEKDWASGHTAGTMAMEVDLPGTGTIAFTSDAVYMGDSCGPPPVPAAIVNDLSAWYASVEKIRGTAEKTNATVICGHDAEQMRSLRRVPDGFCT